MDPAALARALGYPYPAPDHPFIVEDGKMAPFEAGATAGRVPIVAVGSNRAPEQLARKFPEGRVVVTPVDLDGFDSVYSAHVASYGAIPATLYPSPGARVHLALTWLTDDQVTVMHQTEALGRNYGFARLGPVRATAEGVGPIVQLFTYISLRGALAPDGGPIAVAEVAAKSRHFAALGQPEVQERVWGLCQAEGDLQSFILANADRQTARDRVIDRLGPHALAIDDPALAIIAR